MEAPVKEADIISIEDAVTLMLRHIKEIRETETVKLTAALGRVMAEELRAAYDQPPFDRSPVDGYALRAIDTSQACREKPVQLKIIGEVAAGSVFPNYVDAGTAVRIMTGAPIPEGADCIVRQEDTDYGEEEAAVYAEMNAGDNYCKQGEDYRQGTCLIRKNTKLTAIDIGIAASMGKEQVAVYRKPRIALLTTGDELLLPGAVLQPGKIYNANLFVINARLTELGYGPVISEGLNDCEGQVQQKLEEVCGQADLVVTTGGVSVGKRDIMHTVLADMGAERLFWRVALKPGTPTICSRFQDTMIISLSGNPFGAIANLELLVRPLLAKLGRDPEVNIKRVKGVMRDVFPKASKGRRFIRAIYQNGEVFLTKGLHSSGVLSSMKGCNCMIDIPPDNGGLKEGDEVWAVLL